MLDVKASVKRLISNLYECQKKIKTNNNRIRELKSEGNDTLELQNEVKSLQEKITELQKKLKETYHYSY